ncbi:hypothetical protein [Reinekea thalattae]|uniref:DUF3592 domain-containing protein n=1 Tax=Reinekea thalattae TaxID=2593301 RepID=A0A5C8Z2H5_9GAMM|nr:hypothetical protein [Reinekea thalattae]TXR51413.1 hypothetical protein FME95_12875 [Reinekea thalattae]
MGIGILILIITVIVNTFQTVHVASLEKHTAYIIRVDSEWVTLATRTTNKILKHDVTVLLEIDGEMKSLELNTYTPSPRVGDEVEVKYDPKPPGKLVVFKFSDVWFGLYDGLAYTIAGCFLFLGFAISSLFYSLIARITNRNRTYRKY